MDLRVISHSPKKAICNPGRSTGSRRYLIDCSALDLNLQQSSASSDDRGEELRIVEVHVGGETKSISQWSGEKT
jgi:hypothetical protein